MLKRLFASVLAAVGLSAGLTSSPAAAQGNIADVFREFEAICFAYGTAGYSTDVRLELEKSRL